MTAPAPLAPHILAGPEAGTTGDAFGTAHGADWGNRSKYGTTWTSADGRGLLLLWRREGRTNRDVADALRNLGLHVLAERTRFIARGTWALVDAGAIIAAAAHEPAHGCCATCDRAIAAAEATP